MGVFQRGNSSVSARKGVDDPHGGRLHVQPAVSDRRRTPDISNTFCPGPASHRQEVKPSSPTAPVRQGIPVAMKRLRDWRRPPSGCARPKMLKWALRNMSASARGGAMRLHGGARCVPIRKRKGGYPLSSCVRHRKGTRNFGASWRRQPSGGQRRFAVRFSASRSLWNRALNVHRASP